MRLPRFSIANLLAVIGILGVALAALRNPSHMWANVTFSVAFATLIVAIVNAVYGRGEGRAYWLGFTLCGGAYFAVCWLPGLRDSLCPRLASEVLFDILYPNFGPPAPAARPTPASRTPAVTNQMQAAGKMSQIQGRMASMRGGDARNRAGGGTVARSQAQESRWTAWNKPDRIVDVGYRIGTVSLVSSDTFRQIGHSLVTILVAVLGGAYARSRYQAWGARDMPQGAVDLGD
jgi:hypothetical protein